MAVFVSAFVVFLDLCVTVKLGNEEMLAFLDKSRKVSMSRAMLALLVFMKIKKC